MFDKYYKSEYLKIKEYEKISNVSFEKFVLNIIKTESKNYPKHKKSTKWLMMLLSFCFGLFIIIEGWNLFLWLGRDILSIKALLILGVPSVIVVGILLRWIFSNDLTHIDLAKINIMNNDIFLSELYLNHIVSNEIIAEYSKYCTDDIVKILYDESSLTEEDESINSTDTVLIEESNDTNSSTDESTEDIVEDKDDIKEDDNATDNDNELSKDEVSENNDIDKNEDVEESISTDEDVNEDKDENVPESADEENIGEDIDNGEISINETNTDEIQADQVNLDDNISDNNDDTEAVEEPEEVKDLSISTENLETKNEVVYDKGELSKKLKDVLISNSLNNIDSAKILLKDIIAIHTFEKSSPEDSLNKSLKKSVYKEFKDFVKDTNIIW